MLNYGLHTAAKVGIISETSKVISLKNGVLGKF
jgi:hypothetical protein